MGDAHVTVDNFHPIYRGVNYVGDVNGSFEAADSLASLEGDNINSVAITADFDIDPTNNTVVDDDVAGGYTETDPHILATIEEAESDGLTVMVRPLIDFVPADYDAGPNPNTAGTDYYATEFRNYYNPGAAGSAGANAFFASYDSMIVDQAKLAQAGGAQLLDIGTEIDQLTGPAYISYWDKIITDVKAVFTGKLTYSAFWDDNQGYWQYNNDFSAETSSQYITGDTSNQVDFWSQLDYVGIDEYAPLSDIIPKNAAGNPSLQDLINAWIDKPAAGSLTYNVTGGKSLIQYYEGLSAVIGKPLLFTEIGYANSTDAAENPAVPGYDINGSADGATADAALQALLYQAFFDAWQEDGGTGASNIDGVFIWNWEPSESGSPYSLTSGALQQVVAGYEQAAMCYLHGTCILTANGEVLVEGLAAGDMVATRFGGMRRIEWIGRQSFAGRFVAGDKAPVCIRAGALGQGAPLRDLFVSPGHSMLLGEVLVLARDLVNGVTITQDVPPETVHYVQLDFGTHDCVLAEGVWSESFADGPGLRGSFHNAAAFFRANPGYVEPPQVALCAPRPLEGAVLEQALRPVAARAAAACMPGALAGWLERLRPDGVLEGWAMDADHPALPVLLEVWHGQTQLGCVLACQKRVDLREAGLGSGNAGFVFTPPHGLDLSGLSIRRAADGAVLPTLPESRVLQTLAA